MATEDINIVDPDNGTGTNYTSLNLWEDGEDGNLVTADIVAVAKCRCTGGTADTTAVTVNGWTTDATRYVKIWTDTSESYRHAGVYPSGNKYRLEASGTVLYILTHYAMIDGLSIKTGTLRIDTISGSNEVVIKNCVINANTAVYATGSPRTIKIINNIIYGIDTKNSWILDLNGDDVEVLNNTIYNAQRGINNSMPNGCTVKNSIIAVVDYAAVGTFAAGSGYNATDKSSMYYTVTDGATEDRVSQTFTFVSAGSDFHLQSSDSGAKGYGTNLYATFTTDIDGDARPSSGAWCIGADEYVAAGGTTLPVFAYYYDHMRSQ